MFMCVRVCVCVCVCGCVAVCNQNKSELERKACSYPYVSSSCSLFYHLQSFITPPPSVLPAHQKTSCPTPLTKGHLFPSLFFSSVTPFPVFLKAKISIYHSFSSSPPICSVNQSWQQSGAAGEVSDDVLEQNAGTLSKPILHFHYRHYPL